MVLPVHVRDKKEQEKKCGDRHALKNRVEGKRKKPAADPRNRKFEVGLLRSFDGKLVVQSGGPRSGRVGRRAWTKRWKRHDLYALARKAQAVLDAPGKSCRSRWTPRRADTESPRAA